MTYTKEQIAVLGHAFFDGKVLQYKTTYDAWAEWANPYCPTLIEGEIEGEWRIKPDEPRKTVIRTVKSSRGHLALFVLGSPAEGDYDERNGWVKLPELDREITLPEGT